MTRKFIVITSLTIILLLITGAMIGPLMSNVERPTYKVLSANGNLETRLYKPMIIAEIKIEGPRETAINNGFRALADYIFGNNTSKNTIAMTAPVQQRNYEKISMTSPVQQQANETDWSISFVMPSKYTLATLPKPNNKNIIITEVPEQKFAAIKFSGLNTKKNISTSNELLLKFIKQNNFKILSKAKYAYYNPPWTLPFMRRNEIMYVIE